MDGWSDGWNQTTYSGNMTSAVQPAGHNRLRDSSPESAVKTVQVGAADPPVAPADPHPPVPDDCRRPLQRPGNPPLAAVAAVLARRPWRLESSRGKLPPASPPHPYRLHPLQLHRPLRVRNCRRRRRRRCLFGRLRRPAAT
eukprot:scaffold5050_cov31-Prasinocladus_malaysianus.AAC.1